VNPDDIPNLSIDELDQFINNHLFQAANKSIPKKNFKERTVPAFILNLKKIKNKLRRRIKKKQPRQRKRKILSSKRSDRRRNFNLQKRTVVKLSPKP
jgi:hypothetical protein